MLKICAFYGETLGLTLAGPPGEVTLFRAGDVTIALNHPLGRAAGGAIGGAVEVIFPVEKVSVTYDLLVARGRRFLNPPRARFWAENNGRVSRRDFQVREVGYHAGANPQGDGSFGPPVLQIVDNQSGLRGAVHI